MATDIYFPPVEPVWEFDRDCVRFYAVANRQTVVCLISAEALYRYFGARNFEASECIGAYYNSRVQIEEVARRKIVEAGAKNVREILLTMRDFQPANMTTPAPEASPPHRIRSKIAPDIEQNPELLRAVEKTTRILDEGLANGKTQVSAHWTSLSSGDDPILKLELRDDDTGAATNRPFTTTDLENESMTRFSLFRLSDELLRKKSDLLIERLQTTGDGEVKR